MTHHDQGEGDSMTQHQHLAANAWSAAVAVREHLARGGELQAVSSPVPLEHREHAVAVYTGSSFRYERYLAAEVVVPGAGPTLIAGPSSFVAGALAVNALVRMNARRQAQAQAAWQWRWFPAVGVSLTTRRLWVHPAGAQPLHFTFDSIAELGRVGNSMTLWFHQAAPLRLTGDWVPWAGEVISHYRQHALNAVSDRHWPTAAAG
jgi:hypothetical protein